MAVRTGAIGRRLSAVAAEAARVRDGPACGFLAKSRCGSAARADCVIEGLLDS